MKLPIHSLTGLRFFAAVWVLSLHFREVTVTRVWEYPLADDFLSKGWLGVDLFFVLSGFILSYVYHETFSKTVPGSSYRTFILFRIGRIYPVHLVTFLIMMALLGAQLALSGGTDHPERFTPAMVLTTVTMTHSWVPGILTPNMPSWSISAEFFAYLLFPFLVVLIARLRYGAAVFIALGLGFAFLYQALLPFDSGLIRVMAGFLVGMGAFRLGHLEVPAPLQRWGSLIVVVLIGLWATVSVVPSLPIGVVLFATLIVVLTGQRDVIARFLSLPTMIYLGEISYSLYMVHWPARAVVRTALEKAGLIDSISPALVVLIYSATAMIGAILMYHLVEQPGRRAIRAIALRDVSSKRPAPVPPPSTVVVPPRTTPPAN